jgi:hypothetical protein
MVLMRQLPTGNVTSARGIPECLSPSDRVERGVPSCEKDLIGVSLFRRAAEHAGSQNVWSAGTVHGARIVGARL